VANTKESYELRYFQINQDEEEEEDEEEGARDNIACDVDEVLWPDPGQRQEAH